MWHEFANVLNIGMAWRTPVSPPPSSPPVKCLASRARAGRSPLSYCPHALECEHEDRTRGIGEGGQIFTRASCGRENKQMHPPGQYVTGKCRRSLCSSVPKHSSSRETGASTHKRSATVLWSWANPVTLKHTEKFDLGVSTQGSNWSELFCFFKTIPNSQSGVNHLLLA